MPLRLRTFPALSAAARSRPSRRALSSASPRYAQGSGDGKGDPKGNNPQQQGASSPSTHSREHSGPSPLSKRKGTGGGPTHADSNGSPEDASAQSGGSRSKEAKETGSSPTGGSVGKSENKTGPSPTIHDNNTPGTSSSGKEDEVEQHNREFEEGYDRAPRAAEDKVDKKFWQGEHVPFTARNSRQLLTSFEVKEDKTRTSYQASKVSPGMG
ncbi:hypothetical protein B7494_g3770 [Chlorociboria aeruginascens]|nr:hypothetical protein B7494_g3770 [Chlorociboria aeruginascens]